MAFVKLEQGNIFSEGAYRSFLDAESRALNIRLRNSEVSFVEAMMSPEADFTKAENGGDIVRSIRELAW
ncbi:MAG: hypothetical protein LBU89_01125 [Fibromonadaceae bacterium]|nr:hypothetical protein [Fibromonadaceae bacterium]